MIKTLTLLLILFLLSPGLTNAQSVNTEDYQLKIQKGSISIKGAHTFFVIPATFTNLSKDTLKYFSLSCSPQGIYLVDNEKLYTMNNVCEKEFPVVVILAPNKSKTVELTLMIEEVLDASRVSFKIGLNFKPANRPRHEFDIKEFLYRDNVIWSNLITL